MGQVVNFQKYIDSKRYRKRIISRAEALAKDLISVYSCNMCGGEFEVIADNYPERCPCCNRVIEKWNKDDLYEN